MRIAILYTDDVFSNAVLGQILKREQLRRQITVICKDTSFHTKMAHSLLSFGRGYSLSFVAANVFINAVQTLHKYLRRRDNFLALARSYGIAVVESADFNSRDCLDYLRQQGPEIIINKASQILGKEILSIPSQGCYNIHCSLLPAYRGWVSSFWTLQKQEPYTGVTIHRMSDGIDQGDIIRQRKVPIGQDDTYYSLQKKCTQVAGELLCDLLREADFSVQGAIEAKKGSYFGFPRRDDMKGFRAAGKRLIRPREVLAHLARGF